MNQPQLPSDRSFGAVFVVFFGAVAAYGWLKSAAWLFVPLALSMLTLLLALVRPHLLRPFNVLWMKLAEVLNRVVSPIVLGVIFFGMFTPIAIVMRWAGRDELKRRFDPNMKTYWVDRQPPGPKPEDLPNQF